MGGLLQASSRSSSTRGNTHTTSSFSALGCELCDFPSRSALKCVSGKLQALHLRPELWACYLWDALCVDFAQRKASLLCTAHAKPFTDRAAVMCAQTAAMSVGVGTACTLYEPFVVLEALVLTASITLSLTAYTFYAARKGQSFQKLGPMLFSCARPAPAVPSCPPPCMWAPRAQRVPRPCECKVVAYENSCLLRNLLSI